MIKNINNLFFLLSIILFVNSCENPEEPDIEPPLIQILSPQDNDTINEIITIEVNATDNDKVDEVWFAINDTIGDKRKIYSSPWEFNLNTSGYSDSSFVTIRTVAKDAADNKTISDLITVMVDNTNSYPSNLSIQSIEYDLNKMTIFWEKSTDIDFKEYNLFHSEGSNNILDAVTLYSSDIQSDTSFYTTIFDPTIKNWFWIQTIDQANLSSISLGKSNEIDLPPSQINNITVFYANDNTLNIAWLPSNDWDFKSYKLEHRLFHESDDSWNLIWYSDSIDNAFYCSPCNEQDTIQFVPSTDQEIYNLFKLTTLDYWDQSTTSPEFNDADLDGPPASSQIISINYNSDSMAVVWEQTQEDLIEFKSYILYHSNELTGDKNLIYTSGEDDCRDLNETNCYNPCILDDEGICHNNSISKTSWVHYYNNEYSSYSPTNENWFWIEIVDQRDAKTISDGLSNNLELAPETINITSLNSNAINNNSVNVNITWEQCNENDFAFYTLYTSDFNWDSAIPIQTIDNSSNYSFNDIVEIDQTVDNWFWITCSDIWGLESNIGDGMMISQDPMPQAVNVTSVEYNQGMMTIYWDESTDSTFASYEVYRSDSINGDYIYLNNSTKNNLELTSHNIISPFFDPTIENWFKIKTIDNLGQFSFGSAKSNEIDAIPAQPILNSIIFDDSSFEISWERNNENDFNSYSIYESYNSDMSNSSLIQNITNQNDTIYNRIISDSELAFGEGLLFYQISVNDYWGQSSQSNISVGSNHEKFIYKRGSSNYDFIFSILSNENQYTTSGIYDNQIWAFQVDSEGNDIREKLEDFGNFQGVGESDKSMINTSDGGFLLTGYTRHLGGDMDAFLMKLNSNLETSWTQFYCSNISLDVCIDDNRNERAISVIESSDGGYVFTGNIESFSDGSGFFIWVVKTDQNGVFEWNSGTSLLNSSQYDNTGYSIIESSDQNYIIVGNVDNPGSSTDIWINKLNANDGSKMWDDGIYYGGVSIDESYTAIETFDGNYILAGTTRSQGNGGYDGWIIKINQDGNVIWDQTYGGSLDDKIYSVTESIDGSKLTFCGYSRSYNNQSDDIWILQIDATGNEIFNKIISGELTDKGYGIKETSDGGFIISGVSQSPNDNNNLDAILIKTDPQGNTVNFE